MDRHIRHSGGQWFLRIPSPPSHLAWKGPAEAATFDLELTASILSLDKKKKKFWYPFVPVTSRRMHFYESTEPQANHHWYVSNTVRKWKADQSHRDKLERTLLDSVSTTCAAHPCSAGEGLSPRDIFEIGTISWTSHVKRNLLFWGFPSFFGFLSLRFPVHLPPLISWRSL